MCAIGFIKQVLAAISDVHAILLNHDIKESIANTSMIGNALMYVVIVFRSWLGCTTQVDLGLSVYRGKAYLCRG